MFFYVFLNGFHICITSTTNKITITPKEQSKYTDQEASNIIAAQEQQKYDNEKKAIAQMNQNQNISNYIEIATNIKNGELNQTTEPHPSLKNYDHSLEITRTNYTNDGADILADGVTIPEPEPEGLRLNPNRSPIIIEDEESAIDLPELKIDWDNLAGKLGL